MKLDELKQRSSNRGRPRARQETIPDVGQELLELGRQLAFQIATDGSQNEEKAFGLRKALDRRADARLTTLPQHREQHQVRLDGLELPAQLVALKLAAHLGQKPHESGEPGTVSRLDAPQDLVSLLVPLLARVDQRLHERLILFLLYDGYAEFGPCFGVPDALHHAL